MFPTNRPVDTTTIWTSYAGKFESVDINSGSLGVGAENNQPATGAFEILEQLYIEKTRSLQVTQDSPNYEPNNWTVKQASDRAGAVGPNAFDEGEEFTVSASRNGVYYFDGGKPAPILRELQSTASGLNLWEKINWDAGSTIWIRNDLNNRRLMIGIPLITPNPWLPLAAALVPTSPNVILMCNYTGCPTGAELEEGGAVHVTMFGDLKTLDMRRKWSLWQIPCPVAEFVPRQDTFTDPLFLCNGKDSSKIYQLVPGAADGSGQNTDDGAAINWSYCTYGFTKAKQGQQVQGLGALRKIWYYLAATMEGIGQVAGKLYSNSLGAAPRNTFTIPLPFTLSSPQQNDQERVLEIGGQRLFVEFSANPEASISTVGVIEETVPPGISQFVITVTFATALPSILAGQKQSFLGLTNYLPLNGQTLYCSSVSGNTATYITAHSFPIDFYTQPPTADTGTAAFNWYSEIGPVMLDGEMDRVSPHRGVSQ